MNVGTAIEEIRRQKDVSQKDLASRSNIGQSYLSSIENNKKDPNLSTLKDISDALEVPLPLLFLFSLEESDIPEHKRDIFTIVMPIIKSLVENYIKTS